jgi:DNA-binding CsgD family transcriptional regulator
VERHKSTPAELKERIEAERGGEPFLQLRDDAGSQRIKGLGDGSGRPLSLGRDEAADIALEWDPEVSKLHAVLERVSGTWTIVDDGLSRNGTFVNGERLEGRHRLRPGDLIRAGATEIAYHDPAAERANETALAVPATLNAELSKRQRQVLAELCRPLRDRGAYASPATNGEIAAAIHLSEVAVKSHLRTLFAKFDVADLPQNRKRAALAEAALRTGAIRDRDFVSS